MNIKEKVQAELRQVRLEIYANADQERATLEGWEEALKWVLKQLEGEGESNQYKCLDCKLIYTLSTARIEGESPSRDLFICDLCKEEGEVK